MTASMPAPVQQLIDATNAGDLERFLDAFAHDGVVDDWGRTFTGRSAITSWSDGEYIGKNVTLDVTSSTPTAYGVTVIATVGGDGFNGPSTFTFVVSAGQVARMEVRA